MSNESSLKKIAAEYGQREDCDIFLWTGALSEMAYRHFRHQCVSRNRHPKILFILSTWGGDAHAAFKIGRCLQRMYKDVHVFVPGQCKSAGTLLAIAGHQLIIGDEGELGPIDVQKMRQDDLWERASGLIEGTAMDTLGQVSWDMFEKLIMEIKGMSFGQVTFKTAADAAAPIVSGVLSPIFAQIDPLKVGEAARALQIAGKYAEILDKTSRNLNDTAIGELTTGYPDHGFVIDREEAQTLFQRVSEPEESLQSLAGALAGVLDPGPSAAIFLNDESPREEHQNEEHTNTTDPEPEARPRQSNGGMADAAENQEVDREAEAAPS